MSVTVASEPQAGWEQIKALLPLGWRELASEMGVVRDDWPAHMNVKFTEVEPLLRLIFYYVAEGCSLEQAATVFAAKDIVEVTKAAIHFRLLTLAPYLAALLDRLRSAEQATEAVTRLAHGFVVRVLDASSVQRPGATGTTARLHYAITLTTLRLHEVKVTDDRGGETLTQFSVVPGELWLLDRGYSNPINVRYALEHKAHVLCRWNRGSLPLFSGSGRPLDPRDKLAKLRAWQPYEWTSVYVDDGRGARIPVRLIALRLAEPEAQAARQRLRREMGLTLTEDQAFFCGFVLLVTTVAAKDLPAADALELYRMRWQVELYIKREKSLGGLDELPCHKPAAIESWLYAKLLLSHLAHTLSASTEAAFSPCAVNLDFRAHTLGSSTVAVPSVGSIGADVGGGEVSDRDVAAERRASAGGGAEAAATVADRTVKDGAASDA